MESETPRTELENLLLEALAEEEQGLGRVFTDDDFEEMKRAHLERSRQEKLEQALLAAVEESKNGRNIEWTKEEFALLLAEHKARFAAQQ